MKVIDDRYQDFCVFAVAKKIKERMERISVYDLLGVVWFVRVSPSRGLHRRGHS